MKTLKIVLISIMVIGFILLIISLVIEYKKKECTCLFDDIPVYQVYFTKGDGPGTLQHGLKQEGARIIMFDFIEEGVIELNGEDTTSTIFPTKKSFVIVHPKNFENGAGTLKTNK